MGNNRKLLMDKKKQFMLKWECRDLGPVSEYLGMKIVRDRHKKQITIDQIEYANKIVKRFGQENCKPVTTPLPGGYKPQSFDGEATSEQRSQFQSIIGSLLYLTLGTRPDIAYAVILMSQFMVNPSEEHIQKSLYIIKYVRSTVNAKITYDGRDREGLIAYADADWAADNISRKSVTGYIVRLAKGPVSWVSRKQKTIALSSTEAEYMSLSDTARQLVWMQSLYNELGFKVHGIELNIDNQGAIFLAQNQMQEHRSKHIDIRYHYVRECVEDGRVKLVYIPTNEQAADILTKNLSYVKFRELRSNIGLHIYQRGGVSK
jgi:hypothetical protein